MRRPWVRPGQVYADTDPRKQGRRVRVTEVHRRTLRGKRSRLATVELLSPAYNVSDEHVGSLTRVKTRRLRSDAYRLVRDGER
jgi:hypothetical protein